MNDDRTNLGQQVSRDVREFFKEKVYRTVIPRNVRLAEAPSHGMPAVTYDPKSRGAEAYVRSRVKCSRGMRRSLAGTNGSLIRDVSELVRSYGRSKTCAGQRSERAHS